MLIRVCILLFVLAGCTSASQAPFPDEKVLPYQSSGHEQFFLAELPHWANGSVSARCQRSFSVRFFDYSALERIHGLKFTEQVELQTQFNLKWRARFAGKTALVMTPQEEATLFLETLNQVKSGERALKFPKTAQTNIVWWDSVTGKKNLKQWLVDLSNQGNPVILLSLCEGSDTLDGWLNSQDLAGLGFYAMGAEALGPMRADGSIVAGVVMPIDGFFDQKNITLWVSELKYPVEFPAGYTVKTVED